MVPRRHELCFSSATDISDPDRSRRPASQSLLDTDPVLQLLQPGILVVDDDRLVRSVLELGLKTGGFTIWAAGSGREAVELYRQHRDQIHLVLLDVQMPGMNGLQTLDALKAISPAVTCCFLTGDTGDLSENDLIAHGAVAVLYKPFKLTELTEMLGRFIEPK